MIRRKILLVEDLYQRDGFYKFSSGINWRAMAALAAGAGLAFIGLAVPPLRVLYDYAWFIGFAASFVAYWALDAGSTCCRMESGRHASRRHSPRSAVPLLPRNGSPSIRWRGTAGGDAPTTSRPSELFV